VSIAMTVHKKVLVLGIMILTVAVFSQGAEAKKKKKSKKTAVLNFEDELIQGEVKKPELMYLLQRKQFQFKKLIKLRENFLPEMKRAAEEVPRSGS